MRNHVTLSYDDREFWRERVAAMVVHQENHELQLHEEYLANYEKLYNSRGWLFKLCNSTPEQLRARGLHNPFSPAIPLKRMLKVLSAETWSSYSINEDEFLWISQWQPEAKPVLTGDVAAYADQLELANAT